MAAEQSRRRAEIVLADGVSPGTTIFISDYSTEGHTEIITSWNNIISTKIDPVNFKTTPAFAGFAVNNNVTVGGESRFSNLTGLVFAEITIYQELTAIFKGKINTLNNIGRAECIVQCVGFDADLSKLFDHTIINETDFPYADQRDIGKMLPVVYGSAKRVPFLGIEVGASSYLTAPLSSNTTETTIYVMDTTNFSATGYVHINSETIVYSAKTSTTLTISSRGYKGSTIGNHTNGSIIQQKLSEELYAVDTICKEITDLYLGDKLYDDAENKTSICGFAYYYGDNGDFPNKTIIGADFQETSGGKVGMAAQVISMQTESRYRIKPYTAAQTANDTNQYDLDMSSYGEQAGASSMPGLWRFGLMTWRGLFRAPERAWVHILMDTSYASSPITSVYISLFFVTTDFATHESGIESNSFDPSVGGGCPTWFSFQIKDGYLYKLIENRFSVYYYFEKQASPPIQYPRVYDWHIEIDNAPQEDEDGSPASCYSNCPYCEDQKAELTNVSQFAGPTYGAQKEKIEWDRLSADVDGEFDDSGSPIILIETPTAISENILVTKCGLDASTPDTTTYTESASQYSGNSPDYVFNLCISQPPNVVELLWRIALQSKSIQCFHTDKHYIKYIHSGITADAVIYEEDIDQGQAWLNYTDKNDIVNYLVGKYNNYWWGFDDNELNRNTVISEDATSQSTYGVIKSEISLAYIADAAQAQDVVDWLILQLKEPRIVVDFIGGLTNNIARKPGDIITFDIGGNSPDDYMDDLFANKIVSTDKFLVTSVTWRRTEIQIQAVQLRF